MGVVWAWLNVFGAHIMNIALLHNFEHSYPEHNDGILDSGSEALTCAFNRRGTLLAVGCNDGRIAIWDFMTRGIARLCSSHVHPITSLSWSRSGRKLLSSSTDWLVLLWDVASGEIDIRFQFPSPVMKVQFNPRNRSMFLVCPMKHSPAVITLEGDKHRTAKIPTDGDPEVNMAASFDRHGKFIVAGSSKGKVLIIDAYKLELLRTFRIHSGGATVIAVKSIEFARRGSNFLVNCSDRVLRVYDLEQVEGGKNGADHLDSDGDDGEGEGEVEALQRLQDLVNRTQWKKCTFSGDGDYICAGSHRQHALYIWDKSTGNLVKMLTGQKGESLLDLTWHPVFPIILSVSNGVVTVWSYAHVELWSAYAPNFKELDENEEYEERESEFDIEDEDKSVDLEQTSRLQEDQETDILQPPVIPAFCSSEEDEEEPLDWLPIAPEIEDPEEQGWGQLEPALNKLPSANGDEEGGGGGGGAHKRPVTDENVDPSLPLPPTKQPRVIEVELPELTAEETRPTNTSGGDKSSKNSSKTELNSGGGGEGGGRIVDTGNVVMSGESDNASGQMEEEVHIVESGD